MSRKRQRASKFATPWLQRFGSPGVVIATAVMVVLSLWLLFGLVQQVITGAKQDRLLVTKQAENATLVARVELDRTANAVANSDAFVEQMAREQLGYAREGDTVVLPSFPQLTPTVVAPTPGTLPSPTPQPNWRGWAQAFFPP